MSTRLVPTFFVNVPMLRLFECREHEDRMPHSTSHSYAEKVEGLGTPLHMFCFLVQPIVVNLGHPTLRHLTPRVRFVTESNQQWCE